MSKHLIDLDEASLASARAALGTKTIKDTVNEALKRASAGREERVTKALDVLAAGPAFDRDDAWR